MTVPLERIRSDQRLRVTCERRGACVVDVLFLALNPWTRLRGLLARPPLTEGQGMLIRPCRGVHTFFMSYPIDVVFLDRGGRIVLLHPDLDPWSMSAMVSEARCVLELPAGAAAASGIDRGHRLVFEPSEAQTVA